MNQPARQFYENVDREQVYAIPDKPEAHHFWSFLAPFILKWKLESFKKCLEIGSGKGSFQDTVNCYTGLDISPALGKYYRKPYVAADGSALPFKDGSFDAIFTYATHEHIPDLDQALTEIVRVLRPGGRCLFAPAWHSRPWFPKGLAVRPYSDLNLADKLAKWSISFRDAKVVRWPIVFLRRLLHALIGVTLQGTSHKLRYKRLRANYVDYWQSDSDACNSIDPFDVILWFRTRQVRTIGYESLWKALFVRVEALELQKSA